MSLSVLVTRISPKLPPRFMSMPLAMRMLLAALFLALATQAMPALVQPLAAQTAASPAAPPQPANDLATARARLEMIRAELKQVETRLREPDPTDAGLVALRQRVSPLIEELREQIQEAEPRTEQARKRLEQLGAKPDGKAPAESAELAAERTDREKALADSDESQRLSRDAMAQAEQLQTEIGDKRRTLFARFLFQRGPSLFSPDLWQSALNNLPDDTRSFRQIIGDWMSTIWAQLLRGGGFPFLISILAAAALYILRNRHLPRLVEKAAATAKSNRFSLLLLCLLHLAAGALPAVLASWLLYAGLSASGMVPYRLTTFVWAVLSGVAFVVFANTLANATLAPDHPDRRIFGLADRNARIVTTLITAAAIAISFAKASEALLQAHAASLNFSIILRALYAIIFAMIVAIYLRQLRDTGEDADPCLGPYVPVDGALLAPFRIVGWVAITLIVISAITGYVAFASFLVDQTVWLVLIGTSLAISILMVDAGMHNMLQDGGRVSRVLQSNVGLRQKSIAQFSLLCAGFAKLAIYFTAGLLALAPWGVESGDILSSLRAAFFGFKVGDVTVSLSSIIIAGILLSLGLLATKSLQGWLEEKFLPATDLDVGLRNSIKTAAGYVGFLGALALSFSSLGLSLEKLTIVAGALSVGIGFGLQSVVSNFVSGLILLWERPIRVGDLIVVGDGEGKVRRINVRSTEIETSDRSTVIIPNSNLISGVVKNRVRSDRTGRVVIQLSVPRASDANQVRSLLLKAASANADVLRDPPPRVFFKKINEGTLDFELICIVAEVDVAGRVSSDLHFELFAKLAQAGVGLSDAEKEIAIKGLDRIEDTLEDIADAIEDVQDHKLAHAGKTVSAARNSRPETAKAEKAKPLPVTKPLPATKPPRART